MEELLSRPTKLSDSLLGFRRPKFKFFPPRVFFIDQELDKVRSDFFLLFLLPFSLKYEIKSNKTFYNKVEAIFVIEHLMKLLGKKFI